MPTLTAVRGESKKKEAGVNIDFSAIWEVSDARLIQDEVTFSLVIFPVLFADCTHHRVHTFVVQTFTQPDNLAVYVQHVCVYTTVVINCMHLVQTCGYAFFRAEESTDT